MNRSPWYRDRSAQPGLLIDTNGGVDTTDRKARMGNKHHFVSKGYQRNFAKKTDKGYRLTIVDPRTGNIIERERSTKSNWTAWHWNSVELANGEFNTWLEDRWADIETKVLPHVREVRLGTRTPQQRASIINLFAMHLVRSRTVAEYRAELLPATLEETIEKFLPDPRLTKAFHNANGRDPIDDAELADMVRVKVGFREESNLGLVESMVRIHDVFAEHLHGSSMQILESPKDLPGFVLADAPIFHGNYMPAASGPYAPRLIMGPISRRVVASFWPTSKRDYVISTKAEVLKINRHLIRSAQAEVACHPDDALALQRLIRSSK